MAPNNGYLMNGPDGEPVSRTYQYRKVMKPMLERKRRARINRCLDELKELMMVALQTEGENVAKLEKADILELTVRHLHKLRHQNELNVRPQQTYVDRFRAGFKHCATEVTQCLGGVDHNVSNHLVKHLDLCVRRLDGVPPFKEMIPAVKQGRPQSVPQNYQQQQFYYQNQKSGQMEYTQNMTTPPTSPVMIDVEDLPVWRPW